MAVTEERVGGRHTARGPVGRVARSVAVPSPLPASRYPRRWGRIAAGGVVVLVSGLVTASLFASAGDRVEVVALAEDVAENEVVETGDLRRVRIGTDGDVDTIPASQLDEVAGRVAATDLSAGGLLSPGQLRDRDARVVGADESIVGLLLSAGDAPLGRLASGAPVRVVVRQSAGGDGEVAVVEGWLLDTSAAPLQNGDRPVSVVVPTSQVDVVSPAAAEDRVSVAVGES
jgi:hypothetical protein